MATVFQLECKEVNLTLNHDKTKALGIFEDSKGSYDNPREWSNLGKFLTKGKDVIASEYDVADLNTPIDKIYGDWVEFWQLSKVQAEACLAKNGLLALPVSYNGKGGSLWVGSPNCPWDSGQIGWYVIPLSEIRKEFNVKRISKKLLAKVESFLSKEVSTYDDWANGNVYGYVIYVVEAICDKGEITLGNEIDACWGFIGDADDSVVDIHSHVGSDFTVSDVEDACSYQNLNCHY